MRPSKNIDDANPAMTVMSERSRTPNDLLNRALAHINYGAFNVGGLTIFEDPAIAVFSMFPKAANENQAPSKWSRLKQSFSRKRQGILLSVKVSSLDSAKQTFAVRYIVENKTNAKSKSKQQDISDFEDLPEALIADMFGAIPDVSLSKAAIIWDPLSY